MKKVLRFIGVLLLIVVVGVLVVGLIVPKDMTVEKRVTINASKEVVENQMLLFGNFEHWNPFIGEDSTNKITITGTDGTAGALYKWEGKETGKGEMLVKDRKDGELNYEMTFYNPWGASKADGYWKVLPAKEGKTEAVWGFTSHSSYPWNAVSSLMKGMLEQHFEKGLGNLKIYAESHANDLPVTSALKIEEVQFPGGRYAGIRTKLNIMDMRAMHEFFGSAYEKLGKAAGPNITGTPSGLYYSMDDKTGITDMAAAFPVKPGTTAAGAEMKDIGASKAYKVVYTGGYFGSAKAHEAIGRHIAAKGETQSLVIEEYVKSPGEEQDSTKWVTNIIYLVGNNK